MIKHIFGNRVFLTPFVSKSFTGMSVRVNASKSKTIFAFSSEKNTIQDENATKTKVDKSSQDDPRFSNE